MPVQGSANVTARPKPKPKPAKNVPKLFQTPPTTFPNVGENDANTSGGDYGSPGSGIEPIDWYSLYFNGSGMTAEMVEEINRLYRESILPDGRVDVQTALARAKAYVRATEWYGQTYPGIQPGINAGLFNDESGYKQYQNQINQIYQQYYGRNATSGEISGYATQGRNATQVANRFQSGAIYGNLPDPLRGIFTPDELAALADEQAGIDTELGQKILGQANLYQQVSLLYRNFYGRDITRDDLNQLTANGTGAAEVAQQFKLHENENAMDPGIKDLFTPAEIHEMALFAAGGITQNGQALSSLASMATSLNAYYHTYLGHGVSRGEVESAYSQGLTAEQVGRQLATAQFTGDIPENVKALFTPDQLQAAANQFTGASQTKEGAAILGLVKSAPAYANLAGQYGDKLDYTKLQDLYNQGITPDTYGKQLGGAAFVNANRGEIQQTAGAFAEGQLTPEQLKAFGEENAGLDTPLGQLVASSYQRALQRMHGAFQGALASPALSLTGGRLSGPRKPPDLSA